MLSFFKDCFFVFILKEISLKYCELYYFKMSICIKEFKIFVENYYCKRLLMDDKSS